MWGLRLASGYVGRYLDKYLEKPIRVGLWQLLTEHFVAHCVRSSVQVPVRRGQRTTSHSGDGPRTQGAAVSLALKAQRTGWA